MTVTTVAERGYENPALLADTDWLASRLEDTTIRIVDVRSSESYEAGHIPGAVSLAVQGGIPRAANGDMGEPGEFEKLAGALGIGASTTVVFYDAPGAQMGMAAWAFTYYGHRHVKVLDGGFKKWTAEDRPVTTEPFTYRETFYQSQPVEEVYCSLEHAKIASGTAQTVFWDTRSRGEYEGTDARNNARPGRIPNAVHLDWTELLDEESGTFKPANELRSLLDSRGITPEAEINCY